MRSCKSCGCVNDNINRYCRNCGAFMDFDRPERPAAVTAPAVSDTTETAPERAAVPFTIERELTLSDIDIRSHGILPEDTDRIPMEPEPMAAEPTRSGVRAGESFFDLDPIPAAALDVVEGGGMVLFDEGTGDPPELPPDPPYIDFDMWDLTLERDEAAEAEPAAGERAREVIRSPIYLVFAIFASLGLVLTLTKGVFTLTGMQDVLGMGTPYSDLVDVLFIAGFDGVGAYTSAIMGAPIYFVMQVSSLVPALLFGIAIWLLFAAGGKRGGDLGACAVFTAGNIINLSGFGLSGAMGISLAFSAVNAILITPEEQTPHYIGLLIFSGAVLLLCAVGILYSSLAIVTLSRIKRALKVNIPEHRASVFIIVVNLLAALSLSAVSGFFLAGGDVISFALSVVNMITYVLLAVVMVRYRIQMKNK